MLDLQQARRLLIKLAVFVDRPGHSPALAAAYDIAAKLDAKQRERELTPIDVADELSDAIRGIAEILKPEVGA